MEFICLLTVAFGVLVRLDLSHGANCYQCLTMAVDVQGDNQPFSNMFKLLSVDEHNCRNPNDVDTPLTTCKSNCQMIRVNTSMVIEMTAEEKIPMGISLTMRGCESKPQPFVNCCEKLSETQKAEMANEVQSKLGQAAIREFKISDSSKSCTCESYKTCGLKQCDAADRNKNYDPEVSSQSSGERLVVSATLMLILLSRVTI